MSDFLLEMSKNPQVRKLVKSAGLPIPMPPILARARGPAVERELDDAKIAVHLPEGSAVGAALASALVEAGADPWVSGDLAPFAGPGEAFGRPARALDLAALPDTLGFGGLVFDATGVTGPGGLRALYDFLHPLIGQLGRSGRVVVIGRPLHSVEGVAAAAAQQALDGFVRSLAKEIGKRGATAQLLLVEPGAEASLAGPLRFLLSPRSAYVSGQPLTLSAAVPAPSDAHWVAPLEGRIALVTGAARGIGAATARALAAEGARVICLDRPADDGPASKLAREIGGEVFLVDVTDEDAAERIAEHVASTHGGVDVVVHNAGVTRDKTLARMKPELWDMAIGVNLSAVARITEVLIARGALRDGGRLVLLSSIAGIAGNMGQTNYSASKAGVIGLVRALAPTLAARGITVNAIAPGFIETRLTAAIPVAIREVARRMNNLSQGGLPEDVAQAITFFATPGAYGATGQVLRVCGGSLVGA